VSLRTRLLLVFGGVVVIAVALVSFAVSAGARQAFGQLEDERAGAIEQQFRREFDVEGSALTARADALARSGQVCNMALALSASGDAAPYLNLARSLASEQQLEFLEILTQDGAIISSAQWPARFGLREPWVVGVPDWDGQPAFLRYEETPQGSILALVSLRELTGAKCRLNGIDRKFYIAAGRPLDAKFLRNLFLPEGTRLLLWQQSPGSSGQLLSASGTTGDIPRDLEPLIEQARDRGAKLSRSVRLDQSSGETFSARTIPLLDQGSSRPLAILVIASSRHALMELRSQIRKTGLLVALGGILLSIVASIWSAARISRPIEELSSAARDVTAGNWDRKVYLESSDQKDEVVQLVASFNQMTDELLRQRDRAVQAERVAAWRELARRLAHELKNPLFPLQITIENLMKSRQQNSPEFDEIFAESTSTLLAELANLKKIVGRFSDFSKMPAPNLQSIDVNRLLKDIARLFAPQLSSAANPITLETKFTGGDATIAGDPDLLRRAFENLVLNAIDAMPGGGTLRIVTSASAATLTAEISDTGSGLTEEEASRLFTPYYTTKQHGTGLGLAIVQSVISDHDARISVASRPGQGTTFQMEFQRITPTTHVPHLAQS
jgi:two-component system nitrogen regulation sensor histidine kinase NtrY